jgi:putative membrane protein
MQKASITVKSATPKLTFKLSTMKINLLLISALALTMSCHQRSSDSLDTAKKENDMKADSASNTDSSKYANGTSKTNTPADDANFVATVADGGALEVALGHLAASKAADTAVKHFGKEMVHDHSMMGDQLKTLASIKQISIPTALSDKSKDQVQKLQQLQGTDFDKAYINAMVNAHQDDIAAFNKEAAQGGDSTITGFVRDHLPMLQMHLQQAQAIQGTLK